MTRSYILIIFLYITLHSANSCISQSIDFTNQFNIHDKCIGINATELDSIHGFVFSVIYNDDVLSLNDIRNTHPLIENAQVLKKKGLITISLFENSLFSLTSNKGNDDVQIFEICLEQKCQSSDLTLVILSGTIILKGLKQFPMYTNQSIFLTSQN